MRGRLLRDRRRKQRGGCAGAAMGRVRVVGTLSVWMYVGAGIVGIRLCAGSMRRHPCSRIFSRFNGASETGTGISPNWPVGWSHRCTAVVLSCLSCPASSRCDGACNEPACLRRHPCPLGCGSGCACGRGVGRWGCEGRATKTDSRSGSSHGTAERVGRAASS